MKIRHIRKFRWGLAALIGLASVICLLFPDSLQASTTANPFPPADPPGVIDTQHQPPRISQRGITEPPATTMVTPTGAWVLLSLIITDDGTLGSANHPSAVNSRIWHPPDANSTSVNARDDIVPSDTPLTRRHLVYFYTPDTPGLYEYQPQIVYPDRTVVGEPIIVTVYQDPKIGTAQIYAVPNLAFRSSTTQNGHVKLSDLTNPAGVTLKLDATLHQLHSPDGNNRDTMVFIGTHYFLSLAMTPFTNTTTGHILGNAPGTAKLTLGVMYGTSVPLVLRAIYDNNQTIKLFSTYSANFVGVLNQDSTALWLAPTTRVEPGTYVSQLTWTTTIGP